MKFRILLCVLAALAAFALPFLLLPKAACRRRTACAN